MTDQDLRNFYLLFLKPKPFNYSLIKSTLLNISNDSPLSINDGKIFIKVENIESRLIKAELLWETYEEIDVFLHKKEELSIEKGQVLKTARSVIWFCTDTPYVFLFTKGIQYRKVINLFNKLTSEFTLNEFTLTKEFFNNLIESNYISTINQITFTSKNGSLEHSISVSEDYNNKSLDIPKIENSFLNDDSDITELKIRIKEEITFKINKKGRVSLYNQPDINDIIKLTEYLIDNIFRTYPGGVPIE